MVFLYQEADLGLVPIATSIERYVAVDFCGLLGGDFTGILIKYPEAIVSFTSVIDVFSNEVYLQKCPTCSYFLSYAGYFLIS
jgi:hypothetical protein